MRYGNPNQAGAYDHKAPLIFASNLSRLVRPMLPGYAVRSRESYQDNSRSGKTLHESKPAEILVFR